MGRGKRLKLPPFPLPTVPRALSFFRVSLNVFLLGYPSRVSAESRVQVILCPGRLNILKVWAVLFDVLVLALVFDNVCLFAFLVSYIVDNHCILYF